MSRKATIIKVSTRIKGLIDKEMNRRQLEGHFKKRMQIVYQSSMGVDNQDIKADIGGSLGTIRKWRRRWHISEDRILEFEQGHDDTEVSDLELLREIKLVLSDAPRSGSPARITEPEKKRLQALACESPEDHGLPFTTWTHVELSEQADRMGMTISPSHYGKLLKKRIAST